MEFKFVKNGSEESLLDEKSWGMIFAPMELRSSYIDSELNGGSDNHDRLMYFAMVYKLGGIQISQWFEW